MAIGNPISLTSNVASKTINVIATASQSLFTVAGGYRINEIAVFRNGVRLVNGRDFTARDGSIVSLLSAASEGDVLEFQVFDTFRVADAITPFDSAQTIAGDLSIVGVLSATQLGSVNFNLTSGIQTFHDVRVGGALTVAGELTFEDVTNIDSVGYATFRSGVNVQGAGSTTTTLNVTGVSTFASNVSFAGNVNTGPVLTVTGTEGISANLYLISDDGDDNGDGWRINSNQDDNDLTISNNTTGSYVDKFTLLKTGELTLTNDLTIPDKIVHTSDTNTAIRFPANDTFTVETAGSERLRIDSSGRLLAGTSSARSNFSSSTVDSILQIERTQTDFLHATFTHNDNGTTGPYIGLAKQRSNSVGGNTIVQSNDQLGGISFFGSDGSNLIESARVQSFSDGTPGTNDMPGRLVFATTADGASTPTERLRITSAGNVGINSTSPGNTLSVDGDIGIYGSGTNHRNLYIYKDNVPTAWFKYRGDTNVVIIGTNAGDKLTINPSGDLNVAGITTATQLFEGTTRVATSGKAIAMALIFG